MRSRRIILFLVFASAGLNSFCQTITLRRDSTVFGIRVPPFFTRDSAAYKADTLNVQTLLQQEKNNLRKKWSLSRKDSSHSLLKKDVVARSPFLTFTGGYASYGFNYRSDLDTPYTEKNITQHQVVSTLNFTIGGLIPIRVNSFIRRSNSSIFRDITDVQVAFDAAGYRNGLASLARDRLKRQDPGVDSIAAKLYTLRQGQAKKLGAWLQDPLTGQKLIEANEIVKVPHLTYDMNQSDSTNKKREDSLRREARRFLELYGKAKKAYDRAFHQADTLKQVYDQSIEKERKYRQMLNGNFNTPSGYDQWKTQLQKYSPDTPALPASYRWLLGVRNFGIGRNNVNTSELTAKNISLNGVNFEYNSWYYLGLSAGMVNYRFQDFVVHNTHQPPQYMYLLRAGLGRLEKNYFILSFFGGQKQLLTSVNSAGVSPTVKLTGLSAETKWQVERNTYLTAEVAQSFSPDLQSPSSTDKSGWNLSDRSNKALSLKLSSWVPATASRLEAQYKFTGANFQSFNGFQTNAEQRSWYIRGEQNFFNRQLKLVASVRSNDFSNPYIVQNYQSNTVFKSLSLTFHKKKLPIVTLGYMPMSQLTMVGTQLEESRFQTLNASISHFYKFGQRQASTNIVYTKFFNSSRDTGFIYYNSVNLYAGQTIFFRDFTATLALSHSQSTGYQYNVLDGNVSIPLSKAASVGMGAKLNSLNQVETGVGGFINANIALDACDKLSFHLEKGYLPGSGTAAKLVPNILGTINFTKTFK
jgi:hypothetical protein